MKMLLYKKFVIISLIAFHIVFITGYSIAKLIIIIIYRFSLSVFNKILIRLINHRLNDVMSL